MTSAPSIIRTCEPLVCCDPVWEQAYFAGSKQRPTKFASFAAGCVASGRRRCIGLATLQAVEIFFAWRGKRAQRIRGTGLHVGSSGVDLSERLLQQYRGQGQAVCRRLP